MFTKVKPFHMIVTIVSALAVIGGIIGTYEGATHYFATTQALAEVAEDLERHKLEERRDAVQERIWKMEDVWGERFYAAHDRYYESIEELLAWMPQDARDQYRDLVQELEEIDALLEEM
jgi:hypothetical protein